MDMEGVVRAGYSQRLVDPSVAIGRASEQVCCAEAYATELLAAIPKAIVEADFGCGNPSRYVRTGDTVLDLGSGSGKICYMLSQIVGPHGRVIGVDLNSDMLALARSHQQAFADRIGYDNMVFAMARIQDLATDLEAIGAALAEAPITTVDALLDAMVALRVRAAATPLIPDGSVDVVVSNCVINLVEAGEKQRVFREMFRVLKVGGRIAISDNVSSIPVPEEIANDPGLWAGCYAGVLQEQVFYRALEAAGFARITVETRREMSDRRIGEVDFISVTVTAVRPPSASAETRAADGRNVTLIYRGPWHSVTDDMQQVFRRGEPTHVSTDYAESLAADGANAMFHVAAAAPAGCSG